MPLTFLIGGARSGKSSLAVELGRRFEAAGRGPVTFVATAPASDDDMSSRIARHVAERPADWTTVEEQLDLGGVLAAHQDGLLIIDCLTLWTSNLMWAGRSDEEIDEHALLVAENAALRPDPVVAISNEVGMGIVPDNELARRYRDVHGRVNQRWAGSATSAHLLVAGRAIPLRSPHDELDDLI